MIRTHLKRFDKIHHENGIASYECPHCQHTTKTAEGMRSHIRYHHPYAAVEPVNEPEEATESGAITEAPETEVPLPSAPETEHPKTIEPEDWESESRPKAAGITAIIVMNAETNSQTETRKTRDALNATTWAPREDSEGAAAGFTGTGAPNATRCGIRMSRESRLVKRGLAKYVPAAALEDSKSEGDSDVVDEIISLGICPGFWIMHFGSIRPHDAQCKDCLDLKICEYEEGREPIECFRKNKPAPGTLVGGYSFDGYDNEFKCTGDCHSCPLLEMQLLFVPG